MKDLCLFFQLFMQRSLLLYRMEIIEKKYVGI